MLKWLFGNGAPERSSQARSPAKSRGQKTHIDGEGLFEQEIVGESFYQDALQAIAGPKDNDAKEFECVASLVCENNNPHDANAVAVKIGRRKVGHLSRVDAKAWRISLQRQFGDERTITVDALIVGGWHNDHSEGHYGVMLDL